MTSERRSGYRVSVGLGVDYHGAAMRRQIVEVAGKFPENLHKPCKPGDVGYDLAISREETIFVGQTKHLVSGVRLIMPPGIWCEIVGRSSTLMRYGLLVAHSIIDQGYTGDIAPIVVNVGHEMIILPQGTRIAQVLFRESVLPALQMAIELPKTERGDTGFGSTGT